MKEKSGFRKAMFRLSPLAVLALQWSAAVYPQNPPRITIHRHRATIDDKQLRIDPDPGVEFNDAAMELAKGVPDPRGAPLLKDAGTFTGAVFNLPGSSLQNAVVYRSGEGDCMLAQWSFNEEPGRGSVILRDTPFWSYYYFHLPSGAARTADDVDRFATRLMTWEKTPLSLHRLQVSVTLQNEDVLWFSSIVGDIVPTALVSLFQMKGINRGGDLFATVQIGKWHTRVIYSVASYVPERVPPLTEQVRNWGNEKLARELPKVPFPSAGSANSARSKIIASELWRRGIAEDEFAELLRGKSSGEIAYRADVLIDQYWSARNQVLPASYISAALSMYETLGEEAASAAGRFLWQNPDSCRHDLEPMALRLFRAGRFQGAAVSYFSSCSASDEVISVLRSDLHRTFPSQAGEEAVARIRARVRLGVK